MTFDINTLGIIVGIVLSIVTAIGTALSTRSNIKEQEKKMKLDEVGVGTNSLEKLGNLSLNLVESLESQLNSCMISRELMYAQILKIDRDRIDLILFLKNYINSLEDMIESYEKFHCENNIQCPGYDKYKVKLDEIANNFHKIFENDLLSVSGKEKK